MNAHNELLCHVVRTRTQWDAQNESFIRELRGRPLVVALKPEQGNR